MPISWLAHAAAALALTIQPTPSPSPSPAPSPVARVPFFDVEAIGASVKAKLDQVVEVTVGVRNNGPIELSGTQYVITLPPGIKLERDIGCDPAPADPSRVFRCLTGRLPVGATWTRVLALRVVEATRNATGTIARLPSPSSDGDTNRANDSADIVIDSGESLPQTGPNVTGLVTTGLGAIASGGLILFALRRHRIRRRAATG